MKIVSLRFEKKRGIEQFQLEFEDGSSMVLDPELAVQFRITKGRDLASEERADMEARQARLMARRRLVRHLSLRRKTAREAARYLRQLGFDEATAESAVDGARELGLINDEEYARAYVRTQERSSQKGPRAVRHELMARGVKGDLADAASQPLADPEQQRARARELATKRLTALRGDTGLSRRRKLHDFLLRRGYDPDVVRDILRELLSGQDDDREMGDE